MLFNSIDFAIFLPLVFGLYWSLSKKSVKVQNVLLIFASYIFYGWWNWKFLSLIVISSFIDYSVGIGLLKTDEKRKRKILLLVSIFANLGLLGFFKYYNFFLVNFVAAFSFLGSQINLERLNIILPVGISFYTFQTLSYTIDVFRRKLEPTKDIIAFFAFVSFFPQLVAGPIERATNLLHQFFNKRQFAYDKAVDGMRQILWGLFKKIVIADNCAPYVNHIFSNYGKYSGSILLLSAVFFALQIYCDFSGYSDMAIGISRLFGFNLMRNFAFPYFSRDIAEFWRRWHISLSTWFRDYVYIPLGGSRGGTWVKIRNILIIFIVSGFWHGANWTFVTWGFINAVLFLPLLLLNQNRKYTDAVAKGKMFPNIRELIQICTNFLFVVFAWIFFRAATISQAIEYISRIFTTTLFSIPDMISVKMWLIIFLMMVFIVIEWIQREKQHALQFNSQKLPTIIKWSLYYGIILSILWFGGNQQEFIYFQF